MTAIELSAGEKHTIMVGSTEKAVMLRPGEVLYLPFVREVLDIIKDFTSWSGARTKVSLEDLIELIKAYRGKKDIGFKPTLDNIIGALRKFR